MNLVCFLIIIHVAIGQNDIAYDAQTCGISQVNSAAQSPSKARVRRSSKAAQSTNTSIVGNSTRQELDEDIDDGDDFMKEKIMGGRRAERGELPWAVLILISDEFTNGKNRFLRKSACGGTLVSRRHVITAAHCFQKGSSNEKPGQCSISEMSPLKDVVHDTKVYIGGTCSLAGKFGCTESDIGKVYRVARASYQKFYEHGCKGNDIAILELTEDVPKTINHICLPFLHKVEEIEDPYLKLSTSGWGNDPFNHADKFITPYLQIAELGGKLPEDVCDKAKPFKAKDTFCNRSGQQHFCRGDSGGGVTATIRGKTYLMGIVSMGPDCKRIAEQGDSISLVQISTDIIYHKKTIKKWILAKRSKKPKVVDLPNKTPHRLFERTKKPTVVEPPHRLPDRMFEKTRQPKIVSRYSLPHRPFERTKKPKVVEPPHSLPDRLFEKTKKPKVTSRYSLPHRLFERTRKPKIVSRYKTPYRLFEPYGVPYHPFKRYRMPYRLFEPIISQDWDDAMTDDDDDPFDSIFDLPIFSDPWMRSQWYY